MGTGAGSSNQVISSTTGTLQGTQLALVGKNLAIYQADTAATLTISAIIADNTAATTTAATALSKAGPGTLILSGANTYTGVTYFNGGAISVASVTNGATAGPFGRVGQQRSRAVLAFGGGTLQGTGANGTTDHGATFFAGVSAIDVTQSGTTLTLASSTVGITGLAEHAGHPAQDRPGHLDHRRLDWQRFQPEHRSGGGHPRTSARLAAAPPVQQANGAALIIDSGATARVTGTAHGPD